MRRPVDRHRPSRVGLALGLPVHQQRHAPGQRLDLARLPGGDVREVVHGALQMGEALLEGGLVHAGGGGAGRTSCPEDPDLRLALPARTPAGKRAPHKGPAPWPRTSPAAPARRPRRGSATCSAPRWPSATPCSRGSPRSTALHGFDPLETSAVETVEALGKFLPDVDRPNEGVFAWQEEDKDWLALRYDLTAPLARVYAQHRATLPTPYRRYAMGPVWRNEKPGPGRFRQFYQCDADTVGTPTVAADAEIVGMLCDALEAAGIARGDYMVKVSNRKVLNGVLEAAGLVDPDDRGALREPSGASCCAPSTRSTGWARPGSGRCSARGGMTSRATSRTGAGLADDQRERHHGLRSPRRRETGAATLARARATSAAALGDRVRRASRSWSRSPPCSTPAATARTA